jgi:hypothetical protein
MKTALLILIGLAVALLAMLLLRPSGPTVVAPKTGVPALLDSVANIVSAWRTPESTAIDPDFADEVGSMF